MMKLMDLCQIHSGYTARARLEPVREGGVPVLQLRNVAADTGALDPGNQRYDLSGVSGRYFVRGGDVVFRSRGEPNTAAVADALPEPTVVIVPLVIIRPNRETLLPEYLAWAINQPDAQRRLGAEAQGTSLRMIPMAVLENLDIAVPGLHTQKRIVELDGLARREGQLLRQLADRRAELVSAILGEATKAAEQKEIA
jgi:hypothetical protein